MLGPITQDRLNQKLERVVTATSRKEFWVDDDGRLQTVFRSGSMTANEDFFELRPNFTRATPRLKMRLRTFTKAPMAQESRLGPNRSDQSVFFEKEQ